MVMESLEQRLNELDFVRKFRNRWKNDPSSVGFEHSGRFFGVCKRDAYWYDSVANHVHLLKFSDAAKEFEHIVLVPQDPPLFEVNAIRFSRNGLYVALVGRREICVLLSREAATPMPARVLCKTVRVAQHLLLHSPKLEVVEAKFHPGSVTESHVVVLCSDNYLRIFDIHDALTPEQVIPLGQSSTAMLSSLSMATMQASMGEVGMAFDFAPPVSREESSEGPRVVSETRARATEIATAYVWWPIFVLRGDCELFYVLTAVGRHRPRHSMVQGPLFVRPDIRNYTAETTNIICLQTHPPVLVISTADAQLLHAVALPSVGAPEFEVATDETADLMSKLAISAPESTPVPEAFRVALQIIEAISLDVPLRDVESEKLGKKAPSDWCPHSGTIYGTQFWNSYLVELCRDPFVRDRYYVTHPSGVHCVTVAGVRTLRDFVESAAADPMYVAEEPESSVEQTVCTRLSFPKSFEAQPVAGFGIIPPKVFVVLPPCDGYRICVQRHGPIWTFADERSLVVRRDERRGGEVFVDRRFQDAFVDHVAKVMERKQSMPLLKLSSGLDGGKELMARDIWKLVETTTQLMREEYFSRFGLARVEMAKRRDNLKTILDVQRETVGRLQRDLDAMKRRNAETLDRGEASCEVQKSIISRIESVFERLMKRAPVVTRAEKTMQKEVSATKKFLEDYRKQMDYVQRMVRQMETKGSQAPPPAPLSRVSQARMAQLSSALEGESKFLLSLVQIAQKLQKRVEGLH